MASIHEECGVFGIFAQEKAILAETVYYGLFSLQHRGQESCGIVVNDDGVFNTYKDNGLVGDVFTRDVIEKLGEGNMAIGHVRYGTTGSTGRVNAQPIVVNHVKGRMALCHNGNLINSYDLRTQLELEGSIFHMTSDTEVISYIITKERLSSTSIEEAVNRAMNKLKGAYSLVIMSPAKMIAVRDPGGFRPLCIGKRANGDWVIASESCALDSVGATFERDVEPGEIIVFDSEGVRSIRDHCGTEDHSLCVFEYIYFARPDSVIDGVSVHEARVRAGTFLAIEHPVMADVVIGVPDSGLDAAIGYARQSGIPYGIGLIKNKYIGRTFIAPGQKTREDKVRIKLNPVPSVVKGKRVVMVDDSIVRGTTCGRIVKLLRDAGATEVHMRSSAPQFLNPCYYGTDIDSRENLIACHYSVEEMAKIIGVDSLGFLSVDNVKKIASDRTVKGLCSACFNGEYPTPVPEKTAKNRFEQKISEGKKDEKLQ
ncbi:MAG: amidophosphoribosyltransferase [Clostridia bacterium]|nr:amidophosphoribosyltransferase [Clostridia bacterium]